MQIATLTVYEPEADGTPQVGRYLLFWVEARRRPFLGTYAYDELAEMHVYKTIAADAVKAQRSIFMQAARYAYVDEAALTIL